MMKIKTHKINGIDKAVCTAEQKIAYNYAFSWSDIARARMKTEAYKNAFEVAKDEYFNEFIKAVTDDIASREDMKKYNIDAIIIAFRNGFRKYCEQFFIAGDYKQIGECFTIPYEII